MKVLQVGSSLFHSGGIEKSVIHVANGLRSLGHEIHITAPPDTWLFNKAQAGGFTTIPLRVRHQHDVSALRPYRKLLRRERYDVVNTHYSPDYLVPAFAAKMERQCGVIMTRYMCLPWRGFKRWMYGEALYQRIIAVSDAVRRALLSGGIAAENVITVHGGVDIPPQAVKPARLREELNLPPDAVLFGIVSRIVPEKGHRYLLEAMRYVDCNAYCLVVGDGKEARSIQKYARDNGLMRRVRFLGWRLDSDAVMAALDFVVQPSLWEEACSLAVMEAMALGKPLVVTAVGGNLELVENGLNGLVVPKNDVRALSTALNTLALDQEMRRRMSEAGLKRHRSDFNVQTMTKGFERVYAETLHRTPCHS